MFINQKERLWLLRKVNGQRIHKEKLVRLIKNHGISSLLPYYNAIDSLFDRSKDRPGVVKAALRALEARVNHKIGIPVESFRFTDFHDLEKSLCQALIRHIAPDNQASLEKGTRVTVRPDSATSYVQSWSEGFIIDKAKDVSKVRFYSCTGGYGTDLLTIDIPDKELRILQTEELLDRHHDIDGIARYFFNDSIMRAMKSNIDSPVYDFTANLAVQFLEDEGFIKTRDDDLIGIPDRIFSVLAPRLDKTYRDKKLFSSHSLSAPPSERKPHVLRLELTTGCDYNKCTFCSEYAHMAPATKSFEQFREHVDGVIDSIGSERSKIRRVFIGSGNSLGVDSGLLLDVLKYIGATFTPQKITLYGRTASILGKSVGELKKLREAGLSLVYWGLESGSDNVLNYVNKDCTRQDMVEASKRLVDAGIETSAMLIPGLGGLRLSEQHLAGTLELLHAIELNYLTLLAINPCENSLYEKKMVSETDNRHLTDDEVNDQIYRLLKGLSLSDLKISMFTEEIDLVGRNTMRFNVHLTNANKELLLRDMWPQR